MPSQMVFRRYELKYMLTRPQKETILHAMQPYLRLDSYGRTTIRNIYFDTDTFRLIRRSIEKPVYKEKLRLRSYQKADAQDLVFVELKKKYHHVVYKRRLALEREQAMDWLCQGAPPPVSAQIMQEIEYFRQFYQTLHPTVFLSYEREAFYSIDGSDFRLTFDENILGRTQALCLGEEIGGSKLLPEGQTLLEIKTSGAVPLWLAHLLSEQQIHKTSFSKYGQAYQKLFIAEQGGILYA